MFYSLHVYSNNGFSLIKIKITSTTMNIFTLQPLTDHICSHCNTMLLSFWLHQVKKLQLPSFLISCISHRVWSSNAEQIFCNASVHFFIFFYSCDVFTSCWISLFYLPHLTPNIAWDTNVFPFHCEEPWVFHGMCFLWALRLRQVEARAVWRPLRPGVWEPIVWKWSGRDR